MNSKPALVDTASLAHVEALYRRRLGDDPADAVARTGLAWCLFMLALHQAGQEAILSHLVDTIPSSEERLPTSFEMVFKKDARALLRESLQQALTAVQLSEDLRAHTDAEKLQELVWLSGGSQVVSEVEEESLSILAEVAREVLRAPPGEMKRSRRLPEETAE